MASNSNKLPKKPMITVLASIADAASWYCGLVLVALILLSSLRHTYQTTYDRDEFEIEVFKGTKQIWESSCDEIYEVKEGETLHSISDKCGDPFIVEQNPHVHDPDDVFPGLLLKITPSSPT